MRTQDIAASADTLQLAIWPPGEHVKGPTGWELPNAPSKCSPIQHRPPPLIWSTWVVPVYSSTWTWSPISSLWPCDSMVLHLASTTGFNPSAWVNYAALSLAWLWVSLSCPLAAHHWADSALSQSSASAEASLDSLNMVTSFAGVLCLHIYLHVGIRIK